jgi:trans-2,3-dihydro-3-hydroxyanthranilate isomerase
MLDLNNQNYSVVNAFTDENIGGNPAAIFSNSEGLTRGEMQRIARELNFVETVFVCKSDEANIDRQLRFFTPAKELPIAGHPSIAAWASLANDGEISLEKPFYFQKTEAGIQQIEISKDKELFVVFMQQQSPKFLGH